MELYEANKILRSVKAALSADGNKIPASAETDGLMMLLDKLDAEKYLAPKIKHARGLAAGTSSYERLNKSIMFFRALQAVRDGITAPVTSISITLLHKTLCGDLDDGAGRLRTKDTTTNGSAHTDPKYISGSLKAIITKMNEIGSSPETAKDDFAGYLSHYMRELLILHPFDRGSEFTLRIFMMLFSSMKGFYLGFQHVPPSAIKTAEDKAFDCDDVAPLFKLMSDCLTYDNKTTTPKQSAPRTRREVAKDLCRPPRQKPVAQKPAVQKSTKKSKQKSDAQSDDVLKRAIRLQQKIARLNEQLTELITPLEEKKDS